MDTPIRNTKTHDGPDISAKEITHGLRGKWFGTYGLAFCPAHKNTRTPALTIRDGDTAPLVLCKNGCGSESVISALKALGLWGSRERDVPRPSVVRPEPVVYWDIEVAPEKTRIACSIWRNATSVEHDSPAGKYLIRRGIEPPWPETLGYARLRHPYSRKSDVPTLIAARHCPKVRLVRGIQQIFVTEEGEKYTGGESKLSLGSIEGGRCELITAEGEHLLLCEGIESALSAWKLSGIPAWATCGPFPQNIPLPKHIKHVTIIADNDENGGSQQKAKWLARTIRDTDRYCQVRQAPKGGEDANDVLLRIRDAAR